MPARSSFAVRRAYSAVAYAAFLTAALWAVLFLADVGPLPTVDSTRSGPTWVAVLVDLGLWLVFGLQHSVMARAKVKRRFTQAFLGRAERSTFVLTTSLALGLLFWQWRALSDTVWQIDAQPWVALLWVIYVAGWVITVATTFMIDHGEFLGLRQSGWLPTRPQGLARNHSGGDGDDGDDGDDGGDGGDGGNGGNGDSGSVSRRWLYAWVRHPMMVALLVAFWVTPVMTVGHLLFAVAASGYIAVGVHFEERDLRRQHGTAYDDYAQQVPRFVPGLTRNDNRTWPRPANSPRLQRSTKSSR